MEEEIKGKFKIKLKVIFKISFMKLKSKYLKSFKTSIKKENEMLASIKGFKLNL